jgi:hypothetical protein
MLVSLTYPDILGFLGSPDQGHYQFEHSALQTRSTDPTLLISLASASSAVLTALVTGVLQTVSARNNRTGSLSVQTPDGVNVSLPVNSSPEDVANVVDLLAQVNAIHCRVDLEEDVE